jgi:hypothetical protein
MIEYGLKFDIRFYTNLLHTRENSEDDETFNANLTYLIKSTNKLIQEGCIKLKYGKEHDERILINGQMTMYFGCSNSKS